MAVPTQLSDLSATAASNSPAGGDTVGTTMDDYIRAHASIIARISVGTDALATPALGVATATTINKLTFTQPATGATVTILNGKTLTANNTLTLAGTDGTTMTFPGTSATLARTDAGQTFTGNQVINGTLTGETNAFIKGYVQVNSDDATPAGGNASLGIFLGSDAIGIYWGSGAPSHAAPKGSMYMRTDGSGTSDRIYVCKTGAVADVGSWTAMTTAS